MTRPPARIAQRGLIGPQGNRDLGPERAGLEGCLDDRTEREGPLVEADQPDVAQLSGGEVLLEVRSQGRELRGERRRHDLPHQVTRLP